MTRLYHEKFYLVALLAGLIIALETEEGRYPDLAEVTIPYLGPDANYGMTCYLMGYQRNQLAISEMAFLMDYARLLAQQGSQPGVGTTGWDDAEQYENVCSLYRYDPDPSHELFALAEFTRPQDFATRGLDGDRPKWIYRKIVYVTTMPHALQEFTVPANKAYIVHAYADIPTDDRAMMEDFSAVFSMMSMHGDEAFNRRPKAPTDCLGEDDFWDERLGEQPKDCPETDEDNFDYTPDDDDEADRGEAIENEDFADEDDGESHMPPFGTGAPDLRYRDGQTLSLGQCCVCGEEGPNVRNALALPFKAPVPGTGWGCFTCHLPPDGAIAVVCDSCLAAHSEAKTVCVGHAGDNVRMPMALFMTTAEPFEHNRLLHQADLAPLN